MDFEKIYNECNKRNRYTEDSRRRTFTKQDIIDETYKTVSRDAESNFSHEDIYKQAAEVLADRYKLDWPLSPSEFSKGLDKLIAEKVTASIKSHGHSSDDNFTLEAFNAIESVAADKVKKVLKFDLFGLWKMTYKEN